VAPEPFGDGVRDLEECSGRVSKGSAARTYCRSGRTWTLLALPVRGEREKGGRKAGWPGFPHSGKERAGTEGESGKAGVPSQWEGTGQDKGRKRDGRGSLAMERNGPGKNGRKRDDRGSRAMGRNGPGRKGESGMAGVPSQWERTGQEEKGESGMAGVPSQWEGTGQEGKEKAGWPGFPRNGKERARKKKEKAGWSGFPRNGKERARKKKEKAGWPGFPRNGKERARGEESGMSARSEADPESEHSRFTHSVGTRSCFGYRQIRIRMSSQRRSFTRCS
jgi:hypothetical protein